ILGLDIGENGEGLQVDPIFHGVHSYELNGTQDKILTFSGAGAVAGQPCYLAGAKRMVVISATFSYAEQAELYRKALRLDKIEDLYGKGYAPTFEGMNIERRKYNAKEGKWEEKWETLYMWDPDAEKLTVAPWLEKFWKTAVVDDGQGDLYRDVIHGMSVTPLPKLTDGTPYRAVELPGIANRQKQAPPIPPKDKKDEQPQAKSGPDYRPLGKQPLRLHPKASDKAATTDNFSFADLADVNLKDQLVGKINWFSPYGSFTDDPSKAFKTDLPAGFKTPEEEAKEKDYTYNFKSRMYPPTNDKALVRFFDVDVAPGAAYQYKVQLRFANPNYKQNVKLLAHSGLAEQKELLSDWHERPPIVVVIPTTEADYRFYITHQVGESKYFVSKATQGKQLIDFSKNAGDNSVPFQVFKFVDIVAGQEVADWVVAERLLVARGEPIGRECELEVAYWQKLRTTRESAGGPKGLKVDMRVNPAVVLLDFTGGHGQTFKSPAGVPLGSADSEFQALLLMPDMTMKVRNSRDDYDEKSLRAQERRGLFDMWKTRLEQARQQPKKDKGK
ncbi:MAG TPA: hypothetical protein VE988_15460, partial [Gemmataceae bacterium]|nr:hypothetical protein [Gemmataceae bacterium]